MTREDYALAMVECSRVIAFDTETSGLNAHSDYVCGWVVANEAHSLYIPVRHEPGGNICSPERFEKALADSFRKRSRLGLLTVGFSLAFDLWFAGIHGVLIDGPLEDAQLNEVLIRDDLGKAYDLAAAADRRNVAAKKGEALYERLNVFQVAEKGKRAKAPSRDDMKYFHKLAGDDPLAVEYAEGDGRTTFDLWAAQQPILERDGLTRVHRLENRLIPYLAKMRRRGIRVDGSYADLAIQQINEQKAKKSLRFPAGFKSKSPMQVADWLFSQGVVSLPRTATGLWSTRKSVLERLEAGRMVLDLRKLETAERSFIRPLIDTHLYEGRVHAELVQSANGLGGTHTGRFSSREPNLQAYPKRDEGIGKVVRPLLIPDDGFVFGEADVSQQEPRLYAHIAQERQLLAGYNAVPFVDVHQRTSELLGIDRDFAKTLGLSLFNGMGANTLAERLNIPVHDARDLRYRFFAAYPDIRTFTEQAPQVAASRGYIRTVLGRRAYFGHANYHMAVSRTIQGGAADQMKTALLQGFEYCESVDGIELLMTIHDSVIFQMRPDFNLKEFRAVLEDMTAFFQILPDGTEVPMRVPFPVDIKLGKNWGAASYGPKVPR